MTAFLDPTQKQELSVFKIDKTPEDVCLDQLELLVGSPEAMEAWPVHSQTAYRLIMKVSEDRRREALSQRLDSILERQERFVLEFKAKMATDIAKKITSAIGANHA